MSISPTAAQQDPEAQQRAMQMANMRAMMSMGIADPTEAIPFLPSGMSLFNPCQYQSQIGQGTLPGAENFGGFNFGGGFFPGMDMFGGGMFPGMDMFGGMDFFGGDLFGGMDFFGGGMFGFGNRSRAGSHLLDRSQYIVTDEEGKPVRNPNGTIKMDVDRMNQDQAILDTLDETAFALAQELEGTGAVEIAKRYQDFEDAVRKTPRFKDLGENPTNSQVRALIIKLFREVTAKQGLGQNGAGLDLRASIKESQSANGFTRHFFNHWGRVGENHSITARNFRLYTIDRPDIANNESIDMEAIEEEADTTSYAGLFII